MRKSFKVLAIRGMKSGIVTAVVGLIGAGLTSWLGPEYWQMAQENWEVIVGGMIVAWGASTKSTDDDAFKDTKKAVEEAKK